MFSKGYYVSKTNLNVVRKMDIDTAKDGKGAIERVYGSWATDPNNIIVFKANEKVYLNEHDIALPNIRQLIETGHITRTF